MSMKKRGEFKLETDLNTSLVVTGVLLYITSDTVFA